MILWHNRSTDPWGPVDSERGILFSTLYCSIILITTRGKQYFSQLCMPPLWPVGGVLPLIFITVGTWDRCLTKRTVKGLGLIILKGLG